MILVTLVLVVVYVAFERNDVDGHHEDMPDASGVVPYSDWVPEEGVIVVATDATDRTALHNIFATVRHTRTDGDGYEVRMYCASVPTTGSVDPLLATGRFANTLRGAERLDLRSAAEDHDVFTPTGRADCDPLAAPDGAVTAEDVIAAVERAGLPVDDAQDGTAMCHELGCLQRTQTDQFTVIVWPSAGAARDWSVRPMIESTLLPPVTTVQIEPSGFGPDEDREAYERALGRVTADASTR